MTTVTAFFHSIGYYPRGQEASDCVRLLNFILEQRGSNTNFSMFTIGGSTGSQVFYGAESFCGKLKGVFTGLRHGGGHTVIRRCSPGEAMEKDPPLSIEKSANRVM